MDILIGSTGFVGSNLIGQHKFYGLYNSKNISDAYKTNPDLCVYAGVRSEKYIANRDPEADMEAIENAIENIKRINHKRLVLVSTIDVFKSPCNYDENTPVDEIGLHAYGYNRYQLEKWCAGNISNLHILRLPGLFGKNLKKNFIYDLIHVLPTALNEAKFRELSEKENLLEKYYTKNENSFYSLIHVSEVERADLLAAFSRLEFTALNFTDSRAVYQFYNLAYLWEHIKVAIEEEIRLLHLAVEPVSAFELYSAVRGGDFTNIITDNPPYYDFKTINDNKLHGKDGYIHDKRRVIHEIKEFSKEKSLTQILSDDKFSLPTLV